MIFLRLDTESLSRFITCQGNFQALEATSVLAATPSTSGTFSKVGQYSTKFISVYKDTDPISDLHKN